MDGAGSIPGQAHFRFTEAESTAAFRAKRIARRKDYDSWSSRIGNILAGHFLVLSGVVFLSHQIEDGVTSWALVGFALSWVALGAWIADNWLYGHRRRYRKIHRDHPWAGLDVTMTFTPDRLFTHSANMDGAIDWSAFARMVELRDGFFLEIQPLHGTWIPKHALRPPFDAAALASFLRPKARKYEVIDRRARPSEEE